jgi:hypothetical protein
MLVALAVALLSSAGGSVTPTPVTTGTTKPKTTTDDTKTIQTRRYSLGLRDRRSGQTFVEDLFAAAAVNGWYVADREDGSATIELRDVDLDSAEIRLASLTDVAFLHQDAQA